MTPALLTLRAALARGARARLGRAAKRGRYIDWAASDAVAAEAAALGMPKVAHWVPLGGTSVRRLAAAYLSRVVAERAAATTTSATP